MKLLQKIFGGGELQAASRDASDDFWFKPVSTPVAAGVPVTMETALTVTVVYDCLQVLSQTTAVLPLGLFERKPDGSKEKAEQHPLYDVIHSSPNVQTSAYEFWGQCVWDMASAGNFFAEIVPGLRGPVDQLIRFDPNICTIERLEDGSKRLKVRENGRPERIFVEGEFWHLKVFPHIKSGLMGKSPIEAGRQAIGSALAVQDYAARFFKNDATPPIAVKMAGTFKDNVSKDNFLTAMKRWWGGGNRHTPAVLENGQEIVTIGTTNEQAQFLETRKELAIEIARIWRMQNHKVGILDKATFSNIEQQSLEFVIDTMLPWLRLIEQGIARDLLLRPDKFFVEFNVAGLLRGDLKARYDAYAKGRQWGWLSVNDIMKLENRNPIPNGDTYLEPMNMVPAGMQEPRRESENSAIDTEEDDVSALGANLAENILQNANGRGSHAP